MNSAIRILHTVADISPASGGPARSVPGLARALTQAGAHVEIVTLTPACGEPASTGVPTTFVPAPESPWRDVRVIGAWRAQLQSRLKAGEFDVVHDAGLWLPVNHVTATTLRRCRVPRVVSPRGMLEPWALGHRSAKKAIAWHLYQRRDLHRATLLHATSAPEAVSLRRAGLRNPIAVIANGIDLPGTAGTKSISGPRRALFLSRLHPKKGLLDLVQAWSAVRPADWRMIVAGPDEDGHLAEVRHAVQAAGLEQAFEFVGPVDNDAKWALYQGVELFVLPTYSENFGLVIGEALASGVPVITTRETPWPEIERHRLGWWIPTGGEALSSALREATTLPPEALAAMGARGADLIAKNFTWSAAAERMLAAYGWLLGRAERPAWIEVD